MNAPTRAQLAQRRALVEASTKRHPPRAVPRAMLPRPTQYTRALVEIADELNAAVAEALADEGLPRVDAADGDIPPFSKGDLLSRLSRIVEKVLKRRGSFIDTAIHAVGANVANLSRAEWARQAKAAVGVDLSAVEPNLAPAMDRFRRENLDLITSMAKDKVARVRAILDDAPNARVETIRDRILEEQGVTKRQAALIARDQVLSLNAQVAQKRHEAAGITRYIWRTSGDGDVRPDHRALEGKTFRYDDPPVVNATEVRRGRAERKEHPGQDYQCRCTAEPVLEFDDVPSKTDRRDAGDFMEGEHPRGKGGAFVEKGSPGGGPSSARPPKEGGRPREAETSGSKAPPDRSTMRGGVTAERVAQIAADHGVPRSQIEELAASRGKPSEAQVARLAREGGVEGVRIATRLSNQGMRADKAVEAGIAIAAIPDGHARMNRVASLGFSAKDAANMTVDAHRAGLSSEFDAATEDVRQGRAAVAGSMASHELVQAVEFVKNHGGGSLVLEKAKMGVEGAYTDPHGARVFVSLKKLSMKKVGNFEHELMDNEGVIRHFDRREALKPDGERHPPLTGNTALHASLNFTTAEVRGYIGDEPRVDLRRAQFMRHVVPAEGSDKPPCYREITVVCSDGDLVIDGQGNVTRRERSRL